MTIDIMDMSDPRYKILTERQTFKIHEAQHEKNLLLQRLEENLQKEKQKLAVNGTLASQSFKQLKEKMQAECQQEIEIIKERITLYINSTMRPGYSEGKEAPYVLNYALSKFRRFEVVRDYYDQTYSDGAARLAAFEADKVVADYVGEDYYIVLYHYIQERA